MDHKQLINLYENGKIGRYRHRMVGRHVRFMTIDGPYVGVVGETYDNGEMYVRNPADRLFYLVSPYDVKEIW